MLLSVCSPRFIPRSKACLCVRHANAVCRPCAGEWFTCCVTCRWRSGFFRVSWMAYLCVRHAGGGCGPCPGEWLTCVYGMQVECVFIVQVNGLPVCAGCRWGVSSVSMRMAYMCVRHAGGMCSSVSGWMAYLCVRYAGGVSSVSRWMAYLCVRRVGGVCGPCPGKWFTCVCGIQVECVVHVHVNDWPVRVLQVKEPEGVGTGSANVAEAVGQPAGCPAVRRGLEPALPHWR